MEAGAILTALLPDDDLLLLAKAVGEFSNRELVPYLRSLGAEEFPQRFLFLAGKNGFLGTVVPAEYGGQGGTLEGFLPILEGFGACDGSLALTLTAHESLATTHILLGGSPEQKRRYLPDLTAGKKIAAWCLTEPQAGSNIFQDTRTRLVKAGAGWRLTGEKTFITNGCHADLLVVLAQAIGAGGDDEGMTACVVEKQEGDRCISSTPLHNKMGMRRSDTAALKFDDVPVPEGNVLYPVGSGGKVARQVLLRGRIGIGALALGLARDSLERAANYAQERMVAGGSLFEQPLTGAKLFHMEEDLWVAWQALHGAARLAGQPRPFKVEACMAKVFAVEAALRIADAAIQILGGYGYMGDYKVEQNYRDARLLTIGEGASEILRLAIAGNLLADSWDSVLPPLETIAATAAPNCGARSKEWGLYWRVLKLATESVEVVREQIAQEAQQAESASTWQCRAVEFADLATKLWVANQVIHFATGLSPRGHDSEKPVRFARTFLIDACIDTCRRASDFLRPLGRTDSRLLGNYTEAVQIGATGNLPSEQP